MSDARFLFLKYAIATYAGISMSWAYRNRLTTLGRRAAYIVAFDREMDVQHGDARR